MNRLVDGYKLCAVYTRNAQYKSVCSQRAEGEAFIESQKHQGWVTLPEHYDDNGYSGASLDRPALQRLIADIKAGKVDMVVVCKIDRLTRSLRDFAQLMQIFEEYKVSFVTVRQDFDTAMSMVRLLTEDMTLMPKAYEARA